MLGLVYFIHSSDFMFVISLLSKFMHNPNKHRFKTSKIIFTYIKGTLNYNIPYMQVKNFKLYSYINSNFVDYVNDKKNTL